MKNKSKIFVTLLSLSFALIACDSMYDIHKQYINEDGIIYAAKPYEVKAKAGNNRVIVKMYFISGSNLRKNIIEWNEGADSIVTETNLNAPIDSMEVEIDNIEEGSYIFNTYNLDKDNNRSIKVQIIGKVYGDKYKATLINRAVNSIAKNDTAMVIRWAQPREGDNGVELFFNDASGAQSTYRVAADELETYIESWEREGTMNYITYYLPEEDAVDEFPSEKETLTMAK
ncbi:MAG: hypothetical protein JW798_17115 [Prolixibacteraceae bacterium]|nr:hypothetical protein [Prolixibacteraceae bacterium]